MCNGAAGTNTAGVLNQAHVGLGQSTVFGEQAQQAPLPTVHHAVQHNAASGMRTAVHERSSRKCAP
jgi:hypothetical protein